jgi:S1-C subfamily serine protease
MVFDLAITAAPKPTKGDVRNLAGQHPLDGARVVNLYAPLADELGLDETEGVVIVDVRSGSIAERLGFKAGDVVVGIGDRQTASVDELESLLKARRRLWQVSYRRAGRLLQLQVAG